MSTPDHDPHDPHDPEARPPDHPSPTVFTARPFVRAHRALARQLKARGFELRCVRVWHQLLTTPLATTDIILVDYDAAGHSDDGARTPLSAHRLVTLLARHLSGQPTALILHTELDFAEIEDLALAGIDAIISSKHGTPTSLDQIAAALSRRRARTRRARPSPAERAPAPLAAAPRAGGQDASCATVPVLTPHSTPHAPLAAAPIFAHVLPAPLASPLPPA
ncbi:MAG TPA: hypothetical protein VFY89_03035 [Ktedonobacterales bacterium]